MSDAQPRPDGIEDRHAREAQQNALPNPFGLIVLAAFLALALLGFAGREADGVASANGATLSWHGPERIRNGEFFEMRISVESDRPINDLVVALDAELLEDITVNTVVPAATEERSRDGEFQFEFGELPAGQRLLMKLDAQINPDTLGGNAGTVTAYDGERKLAELPVQIEILP